MFFAFSVEILNLRVRKKSKAKIKLHKQIV